MKTVSWLLGLLEFPEETGPGGQMADGAPSTVHDDDDEQMTYESLMAQVRVHGAARRPLSDFVLAPEIPVSLRARPISLMQENN